MAAAVASIPVNADAPALPLPLPPPTAAGPPSSKGPPAPPDTLPRSRASAGHGGASSFSAMAPSTPHSFSFRDSSVDFARVRVPRPELDIVGIAAPAQLPQMMHVHPVPSGRKRPGFDMGGCKSRLLVVLAPVVLLIVIPVVIVRWANA